MKLEIQRIVMKFGGTSVASAQRWRSIAAIVRDGLADGDSIVLVVSALAGISNRLVDWSGSERRR